MDLEELRAFLSVVENGSFVAASETLGVSRATLRRRVDSLEARAGVSLIESTPQGVLLTEAGKLLAARGQSILEEAAALVSSVRDAGREPMGTLRLVLPVGIAPHLLSLVLALCRSQWPRMAFRLRLTAEPLREQLDDTDAIIHFADDPPKGAWVSRVLIRLREWMVASKGYLEMRGTPRSIAELAEHDILAWEPPGEDGTKLPLVTGERVPVKPILIANDIHLVRTCCIAGAGIAFLPDAMLPDPGSEEDSLVPVLPDKVGRFRVLRITVPSALAATPKVRMVLDASVKFMANAERNRALHFELFKT